MSGGVVRPPRFALALLERAARACGRADEVVGDLVEEHSGREEGSPRRSRLWFVAQAAALTLRLAPEAVTHWMHSVLVPKRAETRKENAMSQLLYDLRLALRALAKRPGMAAVMIVTLALGLAANAAIFGVIDALILHPWRFEDSDRIVDLEETSQQEEFGFDNISPATFEDLRAEAGGVVEALVGLDRWGTSLRGSEEAIRLHGYRVSAEFFDALRVRPQLGRAFVAGDARSADLPPVVIGDELWKRQFGGDSGVLGRTVELDGEAHVVVGVAPPEFHFPQGCEVWVPLVFAPEERVLRDRHYIGAFGRLLPGVSLEQAREHFSLVGSRLAERYPETNRGRGVATVTLAEGLRDAGIGPILTLWQGAALFVLMIGWVNLTNLMLARGAERGRELALLDALGAGRMRLVRLQATEGMVVGLAAAAVSLPGAALALRLIRLGLPVEIRRFVGGWDGIGLNPRLVLFSFGLAVVSVVAVTLWPAVRSSGRRMASELRDGGRSGAVGARTERGRSLLVVGEVAAALTLVIVAAVAVRGAASLIDGPQGFDRHGLLTAKIALGEARYPTPETRRDYVRRALERVGTLPGVVSVAAVNVLPSGNSGSASRTIAVEGEPEPDRSNPPVADSRTITPDYFATLRLPLVAGRGLTEGDGPDEQPVTVVSRAMAERYWPGRDPIGKRFRAGDPDQPWLTVVGVAADHVHDWFARRDYPTYFQPYAQQSGAFVSLAIRTEGDPDRRRDEVRAVLGALDPYQPVYDVTSMDGLIERRTVGLRYISVILSVMAALALVLALSGVYAVMAYNVSLRSREIGVRVALGASIGDVLGMTLGRTLRLAAIGITLGIAGGVAMARMVSAAMRGAATADPALLAVGSVLLVFTAILAGIVPARRALALDPAEVLRGH